MLSPHSRRHLLEALRPPLGFQLDHAIGTTFSLDLLAMLTAPLAFTLFDSEARDKSGRLAANSLALLDALQRYADRITIFCDGGRIKLPSPDQLLLSYLEGSVYEVLAPRGGVFHPKLWVLRYVTQHNQVAYRVICLSRNLTFDRSWDTALVLDGAITTTTQKSTTNAPLSAFVAALPGLAKRRIVTAERNEKITQIASELRRVAFELPPDFERLAFHPLGLPGASSWPFGNHYDQLLIISPFISPGCLHRLASTTANCTLVSRPDTLQTLPADLRNFSAVFSLSPNAHPEADVEELAGDTEQGELAGLHAKLYVADAGTHAHIWTGSANATDPGFGKNVELLVELVGSRSTCGVQAILGLQPHVVGLSDLLEPFSKADAPAMSDATELQLERFIHTVREMIVRRAMVARVHAGEAQGQFTIAVELVAGEPFSFPEEVAVTCWPITLPSSNAVPIASTTRTVAEFPERSFEALTSFYAFEISAALRGQKAVETIVLNLPLEGTPPDRRARILQTQLRNRDQVLRFLLLLLADDDADFAHLLRKISQTQSGASESRERELGIPLFEAMVRALYHDRTKLDNIDKVITALRETEQGRQILPEAFDAIWEPIRATRETLP